MQALNGFKVYILCAAGIIVVLANHFVGVVPGTDLDSANWLNDIWKLLLVASGRSALEKKEPPRA